MTNNFDFIDDPATANARIAEHEARLGVPKSEPRIDLLEANTVVRGLALMPTPAKPVTPAVQPGTKASSPTEPVSGKQRTAQAFTSGQTSANSSRPPSPSRELHGVALLAAYYAKHV